MVKEKKESEFESCFWLWPKRYLVEEIDYYIIETNNTQIVKDKWLKKVPVYWGKWDKQGNMVCVHIKVKKDSEEQKYLFRKLGLKLKDRIMFDK